MSKKVSAGKLWSDIMVMQGLEDQLNLSTSIVNSNNTLVRGSETYSLPDNATFPDSRTITKKRFRRARFGKNDKSLRTIKKNKNNSDRLTRSTKKLKHLVTDQYSNDALFNANFPPDVEIEELGNLIAKALGEKLPEIVQHAVCSIGKEQALVIFNECKNVEKNGGMMIANQRRRRTPGGVFLQLFKTNSSISEDLKKELFLFSKKVQKSAEMQRQEEKKILQELKILEQKRELEKMKSSRVSPDLQVLPTAAEAYTKNKKISILNTTDYQI